MKEFQIDDDITWIVFDIRPIDLDNCSYHVYSGEGWDFRGHQCSRKPKIKINGFGFCTLHGKKVLERHNERELLRGWIENK